RGSRIRRSGRSPDGLDPGLTSCRGRSWVFWWSHLDRGASAGPRPPSPPATAMSRLLNYFFRGVIVVAPVAVTIYVCYAIFTRVDNWLGFRIPGVGFLLTIVLITLIGFFASNLITRG